jgi:hypothetical protein
MGGRRRLLLRTIMLQCIHLHVYHFTPRVSGNQACLINFKYGTFHDKQKISGQEGKKTQGSLQLPGLVGVSLRHSKPRSDRAHVYVCQSLSYHNQRLREVGTYVDISLQKHLAASPAKPAQASPGQPTLW